jgi:hypothetical protein
VGSHIAQRTTHNAQRTTPISPALKDQHPSGGLGSDSDIDSEGIGIGLGLGVFSMVYAR